MRLRGRSRISTASSTFRSSRASRPPTTLRSTLSSSLGPDLVRIGQDVLDAMPASGAASATPLTTRRWPGGRSSMAPPAFPRHGSSSAGSSLPTPADWRCSSSNSPQSPSWKRPTSSTAPSSTPSEGGNSPNEPNGMLTQADLELEDMAIRDVDTQRKRTQCPWPRGWDDLPGIHPDQVARASSSSGV